MTESKIGKVTHFFDNISVAAITLHNNLKVGDKILIKGKTTNTAQTVDSIQIDKEKINEAKAGDEIGIKVKDKVRVNDDVYLI